MESFVNESCDYEFNDFEVMGTFLVNLTRVFRLVNSFYDVLNDKHNFLSNLILVVGSVEFIQYVIDLLINL